MTIVRSNTFLSLVLTHYFQLAVTTHFTRQFMDLYRKGKKDNYVT